MPNPHPGDSPDQEMPLSKSISPAHAPIALRPRVQEPVVTEEGAAEEKLAWNVSREWQEVARVASAAIPAPARSLDEILIERYKDVAKLQKGSKTRTALLAWVLGAAVLTKAFFLGWIPMPEPTRPEHDVLLSVPDLKAEKVEVRGDFTQWETQPLRYNPETGAWEVTIRLPEGRYRYGLAVDGGALVPHPDHAHRVRGGGGGVFSILAVPVVGRSPIEASER